MLFQSQKRKIQKELSEFRQTVAACVKRMREAIEMYCETSDREKLKEDIIDVSRLEGRADDIRRELEIMLYSKSLYPESRGDLLGLLESTDRIANRAESTATMLRTHHIDIPPEYEEQIKELAKISERCVLAMLESQEQLFTDFRLAVEAVGRVNELESVADKIEIELIESIFSSEAKGYKKLLLREFVERLVSISDHAENVGDRVRIVVAKRGI